MKLLTLKAKNFVTYPEFEFDFSKNGLFLIEGENKDSSASNSNGAGKSLIFDALTWVLFGKTIRGLSHDDVCGNFGGGTIVSLLFLKDGSTYSVIRYRKDPAEKNNFSLTRDSVDVTQSTAAETQEYLEKLIHINFDAFLNSVLFGQGDVLKFADSSDSVRKEIFDKIMEISNFDDYYKEVQADMKIVENQSILARNNLIHDQKTLVVENTRFAGFDDKLRRHKENIDREIASKKDQLESLVAKTATIPHLLTEINNLSDEISKEEAESMNLQTEYAAMNNDELLVKLSKTRTQITYIKRELETKDEDLGDLAARILKVQEGEVAGEKCSECGQEITEESIDNHIKELEDLAGIQQGEIKKKRLHLAKLQKIEGLLEIKRTKALDLHKRIDRYVAHLNVLRDVLTSKNKEVAGLEKHHVAAKFLEDEIKKLDAARTENPYETDKLECETYIEDLKSKMLVSSCVIAACDNKIKKYQMLAKAFGNKGMKNIIIEDCIPFLTATANLYSKKLTDGNIKIKFSNEVELKSGKTKQSFSIQIEEGGITRPYEYYSGGEKKRISLCIDMALTKLVAARAGATFNIKLFDEVFDNLDTQGKEKAFKLMEESSEDYCVICISHDEEMKESFPATNIIHVVKEDGKSRII